MTISELIEQWENGNLTSVAEILIGDVKANAHQGMIRLIDFMLVLDPADAYPLRRLIENRAER